MKRILIVAIGAVLFGCSTGPTQDPAVGLYVLQTVNGSGLPGNLGTSGGVTVEILQEQFAIVQDGTYSRQGSLRFSQPGSITTQDAVETGDWRRNGTALTLTVTTSNQGSSGSYSGALNGSTLTITQTGLVGVYLKSFPGFCNQCL
jgi:hypothetical protein